jgi:hypothetical protein
MGGLFYLRRVHETTGIIDAQSIFVTLVIVFIVMVFWPIQILYYSHLAHHRAKKEQAIPFGFEADSNGIVVTTDTTKSEVKWERFKGIVETRSMLLLRYDQDSILMIPKRQLPDVADFKSIIKSRFTGKKKLK